ncbi:MAG: hypothetical protein Q7S89_02430, partial [bacterium]|nr:hypothetical protein [bacterium]
SKSEKRAGITMKYVDGSLVRKHLDPFFFHGGHHYVYDYIPKNEVWLDDQNYSHDQIFTIAHELKERTLMAKGMDYPSAHDFALAEERFLRRKQGVAHFLNG